MLIIERVTTGMMLWSRHYQISSAAAKGTFDIDRVTTGNGD